jgi:hypothetical protein
MTPAAWALSMLLHGPRSRCCWPYAPPLKWLVLIFTIVNIGWWGADARSQIAGVQNGSGESVPAVSNESDESGPGTPPHRETASGRAVASLDVKALCIAIAQEARAYGLPELFFGGLIWQESRLDPAARSHVGAQGIAQFMPGTARWRGVSDPLEPYQALHESARWLKELRDQFGNLGLAAAAYNAGPEHVRRWLAARATLPGQTRAYVKIITGRPAEEWARTGVGDPSNLIPSNDSPCTRDANAQWRDENPRPISSNDAWALQLIGNASEPKALAEFSKLQRKFPAILGNRSPLILRTRIGGSGSVYWFRIRVAEATRERATQMCEKLRTSGGECLVLKN